jgi:hypothetical protein
LSLLDRAWIEASNFNGKGSMTTSKWGTNKNIWPKMLPPFAPSQEDFDNIKALCPDHLLAQSATPRILILGVTPALVGADWPEAADIHSVDFDPVMIETLWQSGSRASVHCHNWGDMPFPDGHFDLVVGDCSFNALPDLGSYRDVLKELKRVMRLGAPLIVRFFMQPTPRLAFKDIGTDRTGQMADLTATQKRLLILLMTAHENGEINFSDIPGRICEEFGSLDSFFFSVIQMSEEDADRAKLVYHLDQTLTFPSLEQVGSSFGEWWNDRQLLYPSYPCGAFCPSIMFS